MTTIAPVSAVSPVSAASPAEAAPDKAQLKKVAQQFEALLMRQMLAEARKTNFGNDMFSSNGIATFREMMDSRFADVTAQSGTLGLGKMIEAQVDKLMAKGGAT
jgi:peptidoglycan hydrolase FlgJ